MFAKREFKRGRKIFIEKFIMTDKSDEVPACARWAVDQLSPCDGSIEDKYHNNCWGRGMFVIGSRINHACIGSCAMIPLTEADDGATAFFAVRNIPAGEEITISYTRLASNRFLFTEAPSRDRSITHARVWGFTCTCDACTKPDISILVEEVEMLNRRVDLYWAGIGSDENFLRICHRLLDLFDILQMSPERHMFIYFDMFQVNVCDLSTLKASLGYLKFAQKYLRLMLHEKSIAGGMAEQLKMYLDDPTTHYNYLTNHPDFIRFSRQRFLF
jgi:hypothetical protein